MSCFRYHLRVFIVRSQCFVNKVTLININTRIYGALLNKLHLKETL